MRFDGKIFSNWNKWPTDEAPENKYKLASMIFYLSQDIVSIKRSTYSGLEWLGDIGGLYEGLNFLGLALVGPLASKNLLQKLFAGFHKKKSETRSIKACKGIKMMKSR